MIARALSLATLVVFVAATRPAGAQDSLGAPAARSAATLSPRQVVKVHTATGERFYGTFDSLTADSLVLTAATPGRLRPVALAAVDTLWVKYGSAAPTGAVVGGVSLAVVYALFAFGFCECNGGRAQMEAGAVTIFGGVLGAIVGAGAGTLFPRWRRVFP